VTVDGDMLGSIEKEGTHEVPLGPGRHTLRVSAGRYSSHERSFEAADGDVADFSPFSASPRSPHSRCNRRFSSRFDALFALDRDEIAALHREGGPFSMARPPARLRRCHGAMMWPRYVLSIFKPDLGISLKQE